MAGVSCKTILSPDLGHEEATVGDGYGNGPPLTVLKKWAENIGF
jgi:hypothetical protein